MNLLQRISKLFSGGSQPKVRHYPIYVLSRRCNEPIASQVDLMNELSEADEGDAVYYARKLLSASGRKRCFDNVEVEIWFNKDKQVARHEVTGGRWLEAAEYEQELARFNAPVEDAE